MASRFDLAVKNMAFSLLCTAICLCCPFLGHGGDEESRTPDPLLARQVLSQLSYTPMWWA